MCPVFHGGLCCGFHSRCALFFIAGCVVVSIAGVPVFHDGLCCGFHSRCALFFMAGCVVVSIAGVPWFSWQVVLWPP